MFQTFCKVRTVATAQLTQKTSSYLHRTDEGVSFSRMLSFTSGRRHLLPSCATRLQSSAVSFATTMSQMQFLQREDLPDLAYYSCPGRAPGIVYVPGYGSDMNSPKCLAMEEYCTKTGHAFLRFDYSGCGSSKGDFESSLIGDWREDVLAVLDQLTTGPQILVGSSLGGWLMCLAALDRPQKIVGLVGIGIAPDAFIRVFQRLSEEVKAEAARNGFYNLPTVYRDTGYYRLTYRFLQEAEQHGILKRSIPITCPVRMLHGLDDITVPWKLAVQVAELLEGNDVSVILRTRGGHLLQDTESLKQLEDIVDNLMKSLATERNI